MSRQSIDGTRGSWYQSIVTNTHRGARYRMTLAGDPNVYEGIPVLGVGSDPQNGRFEFRILKPSSDYGVLHTSVDRVRGLERV